jgi:hypothetical protein
MSQWIDRSRKTSHDGDSIKLFSSHTCVKFYVFPAARIVSSPSSQSEKEAQRRTLASFPKTRTKRKKRKKIFYTCSSVQAGCSCYSRSVAARKFRNLFLRTRAFSTPTRCSIVRARLKRFTSTVEVIRLCSVIRNTRRPFCSRRITFADDTVRWCSSFSSHFHASFQIGSRPYNTTSTVDGSGEKFSSVSLSQILNTNYQRNVVSTMYSIFVENFTCVEKRDVRKKKSQFCRHHREDEDFLKCSVGVLSIS